MLKILICNVFLFRRVNTKPAIKKAVKDSKIS